MRIKIRRARHMFKAPTVTVPETPAHSNYAVLERFALIKEESDSRYKPLDIGQSVAFIMEVDNTLSLIYGRISRKHSNAQGSYTGLEVYDRDGQKYTLPWGVAVTI